MMRAMHRGGAYHAGMRLLALLACMLLAACASTPRADDAGTSFIVVRHAEKVDASRDPDLAPAGHARAVVLAGLFADRAPDAIYTTDFRRTRQTVQPTAAAHGLAPRVYDANRPAKAFAAALKAAQPRGRVLVAGHSNTVPGIVAALCACAVPAMADTEYDRLSVVEVDAAGHARLLSTRYGAASP